MPADILAIARFDTPRCSHCGEVDKQLYSSLAGKQETTCGFCGHAIPLTDTEWLMQFTELSNEIKNQHFE